MSENNCKNNDGSAPQNESAQTFSVDSMRELLKKTFPCKDPEVLLPPEMIDPEEEYFPFLADAIKRHFSYKKIKVCMTKGLDLASTHPVCFWFIRDLAEDAARNFEGTGKKKEIAYISLTPLGDVICCINQLEHLKKIYEPCEITVFAIPLIAELMKNFRFWVDYVIPINGDIHGNIDLTGFEPPDVKYDAIFNLSYHPDSLKLQDMLDCKMRYGSECCAITEEMCKTHFDKWVTQEYWDNVTLKKYRTVCEQMCEPIRLVDPDFNYVYPDFREGFGCRTHLSDLPEKYVLFFPGTSGLYKYWPISKYLAVADTLKQAGLDSVFAIGPQDRRLVPDLEKSGYLILDTCSFSELADAVYRAELTIGNDSGPMHFASAFHGKTIHIIATRSAFNWYPYEEPIHSLIMPGCACEEKCNSCQKTCIGHVSVEQVVRKMFEKLDLPLPRMKEVAFMMQDRIGDSIVNIDAIEAAARIYAPCKITVFATETMKPFFEAYAFADCVIEFKGKETELPDVKYDAVFNYRYDTASLELLRKMEYDTAYGYEQIDFPEAICKEVFTGYLPLSIWDNIQLRRYTSASEQGAELIRLVDPDYHCNAIHLDVNTLCVDFSAAEKYRDRNMVLIVPGGSCKYKDWGVGNYLQLAAELKEKGRKPLFILGPQEKELYCQAVEKAGFSAAVCLPLTEIAALAFYYPEQNLAIGNDTGVMHLIRACGCKSITFCFEDTHLTWAPYSKDRHNVIHAKCADYRNCSVCRERNCRKDMSYHQIREIVAEMLKS